MLVAVLALLVTPSLRTPRALFYADDLSKESLGAFSRSRRWDNAFVRRLAVPVLLFDTLCAECHPYFPSSIDPDIPRAGRPSKFDYVDCVAVVLMRLPLDCEKISKVLQIEFGSARVQSQRSLRCRAQ